jgi:hypothetical protein
MMLFFSIVRVIRAAYKALRAAVGIMIVAHGTARWIKAHSRP